MNRFESVDSYMEYHKEWADQLSTIREILLSTELEETVKWGVPAYTLDGKIIVGVGAFKNFISIWFHQGVFLTDPEKVLVNAQAGVTKALRQWRFNENDSININTIHSYILEAIKNQKNGIELAIKRNKSVPIPSLFQERLNKESVLKTAYYNFTPFKQREFCEYISGAKQEATKSRRLEKIIPMIEQGIGLHDKYRK